MEIVGCGCELEDVSEGHDGKDNDDLAELYWVLFVAWFLVA